MTLEQRLNRLEAIEAIRDLKHRYLAACDAKDADGMRACFADGEVAIDFGAVGQFDTADALKAVYEKAACHPHMVEMHHAANPRIELVSESQAKATWALQYQLINTQDMTLTQLGGSYQDEYRCDDGDWKITASTFVVSSTLLLKLDNQQVATLFAGRQPPAA